MQSSRWQHGSSGELDVFGATRYFSGFGDDCAAVAQSAEWLTQAKVVMMHDMKMVLPESFRGHDDEQLGVPDLRHAQELELTKPAGKSKLAAFFGFMVSPSPRASFRKRPPQPPASSGSTATGDELKNVSLSTTSSRESADDLTASALRVQSEGCHGYGLDLGVATGDKRLQGVKVVRASGGDEERWVVWCAPCWDQEKEVVFDVATREHRDQIEEGEGCTNPGNCESDSSSDCSTWMYIEYVGL